jgi:hypothetical protein
MGERLIAAGLPIRMREAFTKKHMSNLLTLALKSLFGRLLHGSAEISSEQIVCLDRMAGVHNPAEIPEWCTSIYKVLRRILPVGSKTNIFCREKA